MRLVPGIQHVIAIAAAVTLATPAVAQSWPARPVRIIVPYAPGGGIDTVARQLAQKLTEQTGGSFLVENRPGGAGVLGAELVARAAPDGYTLVLNTIPLVTNQSLFEKVNWDPVKDFAPIGMVATSPHVLVVHPKVPANTVADLLRLARANPGKLSYASAGVGTTFHLCGEMFKDSTQTFILHVPYRGGGPALQDTLAGQVDMSFPTLAAALPHVKAGTLRALAVTDSKRSPLLPDVPTLQEAGVQDAQFTQWLALLAPAGTPPAVVTRLTSRSTRGRKAIESSACRLRRTVVSVSAPPIR